MKYDTANGPIDVQSMNGKAIPLMYNKKALELTHPRILNTKIAAMMLSRNGGKTLYYDHYDPFQFVQTSIDISGIQFQRSDNLHSNDYFEFVFVLDGTLDFQIETRVMNYKAGDVILVNRNAHHSEGELQNATIAYLCLTKDYLTQWPDEDESLLKSKTPIANFFCHNLESEIQHNKNYMEFIYIGNAKESSNAMTVLQLFLQEMKQRTPEQLLMLRALLYRIFSRLSDPSHYKSTYIDLGSNHEISIANEAKMFLDKTKYHVTREDLAQVLNYNADYINRVFKKHFGCSVKEYNQRIYMKEALKLLEKTGLSVQEILKTIGLENKTHFYQMFTQQFEMTPAAYRQKRHSG